MMIDYNLWSGRSLHMGHTYGAFIVQFVSGRSEVGLTNILAGYLLLTRGGLPEMSWECLMLGNRKVEQTLSSWKQPIASFLSAICKVYFHNSIQTILSLAF